MKQIMIMSFICLLVVGCHRGISRYNLNRDNLNKLEVGMSKEQVATIMGKPYQREAYGEKEYWFYETEGKAELGPYGVLRDKDPSQYLTPVVFENSKLAGWGRNYWIEKEKKFDVKIDQTIKQR